jgi:hypothetical protein
MLYAAEAMGVRGKVFVSSYYVLKFERLKDLSTICSLLSFFSKNYFLAP